MLPKMIVSYISTDCVIADLDIFKSAQSNWGLQRHHRRCEGGSQVDGTYTGKQFLSIFLLNIQTFTFGKLQAEFAALNAAGYAIGDRYCTHKVFS